MSNLAASAVTVLRSWLEGGITGKEFVCLQVSLVLTGQGGATNKILASVLGLTKVYEVSNGVASDNSLVVPAAPSADGSFILLGGVVDTGIAQDPGDLTGVTVTLTVKGSPRTS
jgi:hypothetical protein